MMVKKGARLPPTRGEIMAENESEANPPDSQSSIAEAFGKGFKVQVFRKIVALWTVSTRPNLPN